MGAHEVIEMEPNFFRKVLIFGLVLTLSLVLNSLVSSGAELDDIKAAIKAKGAKWTAGETSVSQLSMEQKQRRLGSLVPEGSGAGQLSFLSPAISLPASLDWRNYNGKNFVTPVRNIENCSSSWAFAPTAGLESYTLRKNNTPGVDLNLSEQVLISCANAGDCGGGWLSKSSDFIRKYGLPLESCYPYTAATGSCSDACSDWSAHAYKIDSWFYVVPIGNPSRTSVGDIKNALFMHGPLVSSMVVFNDFSSYISEIYSYSGVGIELGRTAIIIIGYDDPGQYFIAKNFWGTSWGDLGFFKIAYDQVFNVVKFGQETIAYVHKAAAPASWLWLLLDD
jgi:C1A family cysteine protease